MWFCINDCTDKPPFISSKSRRRGVICRNRCYWLTNENSDWPIQQYQLMHVVLSSLYTASYYFQAFFIDEKHKNRVVINFPPRYGFVVIRHVFTHKWNSQISISIFSFCIILSYDLCYMTVYRRKITDHPIFMLHVYSE